MNYEQMQQRLAAGMTIIENVSGNLQIGAHAYMIFVPDADIDHYSESQITEMQETLGWSYSKDFGWVFPCTA